jgi:hypothetical protein
MSDYPGIGTIEAVPRFHTRHNFDQWEAKIPQFFFDYFDGRLLEEDQYGLEFPDVDAAYLEAFRAATDIWGEALRERRNPTLDYFRIRDRTGVVVLELPFTEVLESTGGRLASSPKAGVEWSQRSPSSQTGKRNSAWPRRAG